MKTRHLCVKQNDRNLWQWVTYGSVYRTFEFFQICFVYFYNFCFMLVFICSICATFCFLNEKFVSMIKNFVFVKQKCCFVPNLKDILIFLFKILFYSNIFCFSYFFLNFVKKICFLFKMFWFLLEIFDLPDFFSILWGKIV